MRSKFLEELTTPEIEAYISNGGENGYTSCRGCGNARAAPADRY